ncbi:hypothetical protein AAHA92_09961 [Salvia divinorum]|uniref:Uncharacterized protein n=1 Tax=Salvia divinorum TaxID=28513 RepID=A0ABD1HT45_SALDI
MVRTHKNNNKTNILSQFKQREDSNINLVPKAKSTHKVHKFSIGGCPSRNDDCLATILGEEEEMRVDADELGTNSEKHNSSMRERGEGDGTEGRVASLAGDAMAVQERGSTGDADTPASEDGGRKVRR